jgi:hypothetical protein
MKQKRFKIPIYDFSVVFVEYESAADADKVDKLYKELKISEEDLNDTKKGLMQGARNGGNTFRNCDMKKFLIEIFPTNSDMMRRNIVAHESRHLADRVLEWAAVTDIEAAAFLQGYIAQFIY